MKAKITCSKCMQRIIGLPATLVVVVLLARSASAATLGEWLFDSPVGPSFAVSNEVPGGVTPVMFNWNPTTYGTNFQVAGGPFLTNTPYHSVGMLQIESGGDKSAYANPDGINWVGKQLTIEMWIYPIKPGASSIEYPVSVNEQILRLDSVTGGYQLTGQIFGTNGATYAYPTLSPIPTGTWSHIAMTYDGANLKTYVNGVLDGSTAVTTLLTNGTSQLNIGSGYFGTSPFSGNIDEVRISDVALLPGDGSGKGVLAWNATLVPEPSLMALISLPVVFFLRRKAPSK